MSLQLINHLPNGTTQKIDLGSVAKSIKANSNHMYELRDTVTRKAPKSANAKKNGKNLELDIEVDGVNSHLVIEDYYVASNAQLIGDLGNGEFYPLLADGSSSIPVANLPHTAALDSGAYAGYGSDFVNVGAVASTGTSWAAYALGGLAVAGGVAAAAGGGGGSSSAATTTPPPTNAPTATITLSDTQINTGEKPEVKIVFSEAVSGFSESDLVVPNGSVSGLSSADNITWTGIYTPSTNTIDDTNFIGLYAGSYTSLSGVAGAAAVSNNYTVDTTVAPPPALTVTLDDDESGVANIAGGSVLYTFTFSEAVVGFDASDVVVTNGTKGTLSQTNPTTYTMKITPTQGFKGDMTVEVPAGVATSTASSVTNSASYQSFQNVDTIAPTVVSATLADTTLITGETTEFTVVFSEAVVGFSNSDLDMSASNGTLSTLSSNDGGVTWKAIFTPSANINDTTNIIRVLNIYSDSASNSGSFGATANYIIDTANTTTTPTTPTDTIKPILTITDDESAEVANMDGTNDANGSNILYTFTFNEAVNDFAIGDIVLSGGTAGTFTKISDTQYTLMVIPTPGLEGILSVSVAKDTYHDLAGNTGSDNSDTIVNQTVDMRAPFPVGTNDPAVTSITTDPANQRIIITFDENLEQVNQTDPTSFGVMINGMPVVVKAIGVSDNVAGMQDNQVFLYLETPVNARGELFDWSNAGITVSYTDTSGDLPSIIQDLAGNDATSFNDSVTDTLAPDAKIEMSDGNLSSGDKPIVTFKFSEAVNLGIGDINLTNANGIIDKLTSEDGGKTWTAEFTPTNGIIDTTNVISLYNTYTDLYGNTGTVASSANYTIDTLASKLVSATGDRETDTITLTFDEVLDATNFSPGSMFTVTDGTKTPAIDDGDALQTFAITSVSIDGNKAILSIDASVKSDAGSTWKVTYNDPSGNDAQALQDLYGSDVSSFTTNIVI